MQTGKLRCLQPALPAVVLVACGSYNPPTLMHLRMFDVAADALREKGVEVWGGYLSPVADAYGKKGLLSAKHRLAMCEAAVKDHPWVACDPWEAQQPTYTRTLPLLRRMQHELEAWWASGGRPATRGGTQSQLNDKGPPSIMLLCGEDVLMSMTIPGVWEDPDTLLQEYGAVCIQREATKSPYAVPAALADKAKPGQTTRTAREVLADPTSLLSRHKERVHLAVDPLGSNLSSTLVRQELAAGRSVRYMVPDGVFSYLEENTELYRAKAAL